MRQTVKIRYSFHKIVYFIQFYQSSLLISYLHKLGAMFAGTDIMNADFKTEEMGKYLVLRLSFSGVSVDGDVKINFRKNINTAVKDFSKKYHKAGLLEELVDIDADDSLNSLMELFGVVRRSGRQVYLIVDECDAFTNRLLLSIDTSKPDLGLGQYERAVTGKESMLREWGNVIKEGTVGGTIARAFFTGVAPQAFSDGLSSLNMVKDLTFDSDLEGLFGLNLDDVRRGLSLIGTLTPLQREQYLDQMRRQYDGYRFVATQKEPLFNTQYVLYFLDHLDRKGVPPRSLVDPAVSGSTDNVAEFLIANYKANAPYTLKNFAVGMLVPQEMGTFQREVVPAFRSSALFHEGTVSESLISLAFFHGFLTYKPDKNQRSVLTSPNVVMQTVYVRALFAGLPKQRMDELEAIVRSAEPDLPALKRIVLLGVDEASKAAGKATGEALMRSLAKIIRMD